MYLPSMTVQYDSNSVTLEVRLPGDMDGDGFIGSGDLNIVLSHWNQTVPAGSWIDGDGSGDGYVGLDDLDILLNHWNTGTPPINDSGTVIPEPAAWQLFIFAVALLGFKRPKNQPI